MSAPAHLKFGGSLNNCLGLELNWEEVAGSRAQMAGAPRCPGSRCPEQTQGQLGDPDPISLLLPLPTPLSFLSSGLLLVELCPLTEKW